MSSYSEKTPPLFNRQTDDYWKWRRKFKLWQIITDVVETKHGGLLTLHLDDETQDTIYDLLTIEEITSRGGVTKILSHLDEIFQIDQVAADYKAYEEFITYRRPEHLSVPRYCRAFQQKLKKLQASGCVIADNILAVKVIECANLSDFEKVLIRATVTEITYSAVIKQLCKVFNTRDSEDSTLSDSASEVNVNHSIGFAGSINSSSCSWFVSEHKRIDDRINDNSQVEIFIDQCEESNRSVKCRGDGVTTRQLIT